MVHEVIAPAWLCCALDWQSSDVQGSPYGPSRGRAPPDPLPPEASWAVYQHGQLWQRMRSNKGSLTSYLPTQPSPIITQKAHSQQALPTLASPDHSEPSLYDGFFRAVRPLLDPSFHSPCQISLEKSHQQHSRVIHGRGLNVTSDAGKEKPVVTSPEMLLLNREVKGSKAMNP